MMSYVNLVPPDIRKQAFSRKMLRRWHIIALATLVIGILLASPYQASKQALTYQILELAPTAHRSQLIEKQLQDLGLKINRIDLARNRHASMTGQYPPLASIAVVSEFCARHPGSIQIIAFDYTNNRFPKREDLPSDILELSEDTPPPPVSPTTQPTEELLGTVVVRAKLSDPALATTLLGTLKASKLFKEVTLIKHNVDREDESYSSTIDLTCKF